jgi:putative copper export protein
VGTLAVTWYQWFLFFHILAATMWVGGGLALTVLSLSARRAGREQELILVRLGTTIGGPFFGVAGMALLGFGIALVENGNWDWSTFFVIFGLIAWAWSAAVGIFYYGPEQQRIDAALGRGDEATVSRLLARFHRVGQIDSLVLVVAVFVMTAKPWL